MTAECINLRLDQGVLLPVAYQPSLSVRPRLSVAIEAKQDSSRWFQATDERTHPGMAGSDVLTSSQQLPESAAQHPITNVSSRARPQSPGNDGILKMPSESPQHTDGTLAAPAKTDSSHASPHAAEPAAIQHLPAPIPDLPSIDFVPAGKIESADFALYAQMHLHNPQHHQQQWEHSEFSPPHPVIESFPSFKTSRDADSTVFEVRPECAAVQQQEYVSAESSNAGGPEASEGGVHRHLQLQMADSGAPLATPSDHQLSSSSSHSSLASPTQQQQSAAAANAAARRKSVSLLSQQIATARTAASAATAVECDAGASGRHRSEFWRYLQEQRAKDTADRTKALARSSPQQKHQQQQQQHQQAQQQVIVQVEEASPVHKHKTQHWQHQHDHTEQQQQYQPEESAGLHQQQWQQLPPLPPRAMSLTRQLSPPQEQQQQQQHHQQQQQQQQQTTTGSSNRQARHMCVVGKPADASAPTTAQAAPPPAAAAAAERDPAGVSKRVIKPTPHAAAAAVAAAGSTNSQGLLEPASGSQDAGGGWAQQDISGCADAAATPQRRCSSQDGSSYHKQASNRSAATDPEQSLEQPLLLIDDSAVDLAALVQQQQQQQQQQQWPFRHWGFSDGLLLPVQQQQQQYDLWSQGSGIPPAEGYTSLGQLPGDSVKLNEMLAAAATGTPPLPPRGSKFDDMDSFSDSLHGGSFYGTQPQPTSAGWQQQQQRRQRPESANIRRPILSDNSREVALHSHRSLTQLVAAAAAAFIGSSSTSSSLIAPGGATSAAGVVTEHLDGLLGDLSLFGERAASEVGQELAVANSIYQVMYHNRSRPQQGCNVAGSGASSSRQHSRSGAAASQLHHSGMQQLSGWVSHAVGNASSWLIKSAATALRTVTGSNSCSGPVGYGSSHSVGGDHSVSPATTCAPADHNGPAAAAVFSGTLWQYGASSSTVGAAASNRTGQQQQQQQRHHRQQLALGKAARRWR